MSPIPPRCHKHTLHPAFISLSLSGIPPTIVYAPCVCAASHHTINKLTVQDVFREQTHKQEGEEEINVGKKAEK